MDAEILAIVLAVVGVVISAGIYFLAKSREIKYIIPVDDLEKQRLREIGSLILELEFED